MKHLLLVAALLAVASSCDLQCRWTQWKARYNKVYTATEDAHRFSVYKAQLAEIDRLNAKMPSARFAENMFTDLTSEEFRSTYAKLDTTAKREPFAVEAPLKPAKRVDYSSDYMSTSTPAQDQAQCGSCWAFASAGMIEGAYKHATGNTVRLAPMQLVDCSTRAYGCQGGTFEAGAGWWRDQTAAGQGGAAYESDYPYTASSGQTSGSCLKSSGSIGVSSITNVAFNEAVGSGVDTYLVNYGPLGMTIDATTLQSYAGGVLQDSSECNQGVDHAVLLVGWATINGQSVWIVKNSWSQSWGITPTVGGWSDGGGFFYIARGNGACMITVYGVYYAITSGGSDPASNPCTPATYAEACTNNNYVCGTVSDGCGGAITCGTCGSNQQCSSGQCSDLPTSSWEAYMPGDQISDWIFPYNGNMQQLVNNDGSEHRLRWTSAASLVSTSWTKFSTNVYVADTGNVAIGLRLDQPNYPDSFLIWRVVASSTSATLNECYRITDTEYCWQQAEFSFTPSDSWHTFEVIYQNDDSNNVVMTPYWDGQGVSNGGLDANSNTAFYIGPRDYYWPNAGYPFIGASGNGKAFYGSSITTQSAVSATLSTCHTELDIKGYCAKLLQVPLATIVSANGQKGTECTVSGKNGFRKFEIVLAGTNVTKVLGYGAPGHEIPFTQSSTALATKLQSMLSTGNPSQVGFAVTKAALSSVPVTAAATATTVVAVAAAGLSTAAIIGIAAGGSVAGVALAGGAAAGVVVAVRRSRRQEHLDVPQTPENPNPLRKTLKDGIDVMGGTGVHQSITGRAPPVS